MEDQEKNGRLNFKCDLGFLLLCLIFVSYVAADERGLIPESPFLVNAQEVTTNPNIGKYGREWLQFDRIGYSGDAIYYQRAANKFVNIVSFQNELQRTILTNQDKGKSLYICGTLKGVTAGGTYLLSEAAAC